MHFLIYIITKRRFIMLDLLIENGLALADSIHQKVFIDNNSNKIYNLDNDFLQCMCCAVDGNNHKRSIYNNEFIETHHLEKYKLGNKCTVCGAYFLGDNIWNPNI